MWLLEVPGDGTDLVPQPPTRPGFCACILQLHLQCASLTRDLEGDGDSPNWPSRLVGEPGGTILRPGPPSCIGLCVLVDPTLAFLQPRSSLCGEAVGPISSSTTFWTLWTPFLMALFPGLTVPMFIPLSQGGTEVGCPHTCAQGHPR